MTLAGKPVSHYRPRRREIAWEPLIRRFPEKPPLFEWVLLSMLLHALAIVLFGAPANGTSEGRAMWGSLQVVLTKLAPEASPSLKLDRGGIEAPQAQLAPPPQPAPAQRPRVPTAKPSLRAAPKIEPAAPPVEAPPLPEEAPKVEPIVIPPVLERLVVPDRPIEVPPAFTVPPPTVEQAPVPVTAPAAPAPPPAAPTRETPAIKEAPVSITPRVPQVERAPAEVPKVSTPLLAPVEPAVVKERLAPVPELELPRIQTQTETVPAMAAPPVITQPIEMQQPVAVPRLQELAPAPVITQPIESKALSAPKVQELAPVPNIETLARPVEAPPIAPPVATPTPAPTPAPTIAPQAEPRAEPRFEPRVEPQPQAAPQATERQAPTREAPSPRPSPAPAPAAPGIPSEFRKKPDAPSSDYDPFSTPAPKELDLDAMKRRAGQLARGTGNTAVFAFPMPAVPPKKSKIEEAIENARKPDCRTAYAGLGLAAVVPLVANEFGEGTCRW